MDIHRTAAVLRRPGHQHLHLDRPGRLQEQRGLQGQFLHPVAADRVPGAQDHVQQRRAGHQHAATYGVVAQPGLFPQ